MQASKAFIIFIYESQNNKIYPMWAMFYQWPQIPKNFTFKNFVHCNRGDFES